MKIVYGITLVILALCPSAIPTSIIIAENFCEEADHYLSYPLNSLVEFGDVDDVILGDEFIALPETFSVIDAIRLLNPAAKWHGGKKEDAKRPNTHYVALRVEPTDGIFTFSDIS